MKLYRFLSLITALMMVLSFSFVPNTPAQAVVQAPEPQANLTRPFAPVVFSPQDQVVGPNTTDPTYTPELVVMKTADNDFVEAGQTIGFVVTVTNTSQKVLTNVLIYDPYLAPGTTWNVDDTQHCTVDGTVVNCHYDSLQPGASVAVHITGVATPEMCGVIQNKAWAAADGVYRVRSPWVYVTINCGPDLEVTKTAEKNTINPGETARFIITVTNAGTGAAQGVVLNDPLPSTADLDWVVDPTGDGAQCGIAGGVLTCNFGGLAPNETRTVSVSAVVPANRCDTQIVNTVTVSAANENPAIEGDNTNSATIYLNCTTLELEKEADATGVAPGSPIGFTITVRNTGQSAATNVVIHDQLESSVDWTADQAACLIDANGMMTCTFAQLVAGQEVSVHVTSTAAPGLCGNLTNTATLTADNFTQELVATADIFIDCCYDIRVTKRANDSSIFPGEQASYTMTVTNIGDGILEDATLTDVLPPSLTWTIAPGADGASCSITGGVLTCNFGEMAPDEVREVTVLSEPISAETCGAVITNQASVSASNESSVIDFPGIDLNNVSADTIVVGCATLQVNKVADAAEVGVGEPMGFVITVTNGTAASVSGVTLTDTLTQGVNWMQNSRFCSIAAGVLTCDFGTLAAHAAVSVHIVGTTTQSMCSTQWVNTATASATGFTAVSGSDAVSVICGPDVRIVKDAALSSVPLGQSARYNLLVSNVGSADAVDVMVEDELPDTPGLVWSVVPSTDSATCTITAGVLSCAIGTLPAGEDLVISVQAPVTVENCGEAITNTATVSASNEPAVNAVDNSDSAIIQLTCNPLQVTKTADASTVGLGQTIGFTITVLNRSGQAAANLVLQDYLGTQAAWTVDNTQACQIVDGLLTCNFGNLAGQTSVTVHVTGISTQVMCGTDLVNKADASSDNFVGKVSGTATVSIECETQEPNLVVTKTAAASALWLTESAPTATARFDITVRNTGPAAATGVVLTDPLPKALSGDSQSPNPTNLPDLLVWSIVAGGNSANCSIANRVLSCNFGSIAANATRTVAISAAANLATFSNASQTYGIRSPQLFINQVSVSATNEVSSADNHAEAQIDVFFPGLEVQQCYSPITIYENRFNGSEFGTATWGNTRLTTTPDRLGYTPETFLGEYTNEQIRFGFKAPANTVSDADHRFVRLTLDLYLLRSWDGTPKGVGPDLWRLNLLGPNNELQSNLLEYTFSNWLDDPILTEQKPQSFPYITSWGLTNRPGTGAKAVNSLPYLYNNKVHNTTYQISYYMPRTTDPVNLGFSGAGLQLPFDESWGIDNVKVEMCRLDPALALNIDMFLPMVGPNQ